jgi:hypothetical protein
MIASDGVFLTKAALAEFSAIDFTGAAKVSDQKVTGQWFGQIRIVVCWRSPALASPVCSPPHLWARG